MFRGCAEKKKKKRERERRYEQVRKIMQREKFQAE